MLVSKLEMMLSSMAFHRESMRVKYLEELSMDYSWYKLNHDLKLSRITKSDDMENGKYSPAKFTNFVYTRTLHSRKEWLCGLENCVSFARLDFPCFLTVRHQTFPFYS